MKTLRKVYELANTARKEGVYDANTFENLVSAVAVKYLAVYSQGTNLNYNEQSLARTNKIEAIKAYRERTNASLLDAKNTVEAWMKTVGLY